MLQAVLNLRAHLLEALIQLVVQGVEATFDEGVGDPDLLFAWLLWEASHCPRAEGGWNIPQSETKRSNLNMSLTVSSTQH